MGEIYGIGVDSVARIGVSEITLQYKIDAQIF